MYVRTGREQIDGRCPKIDDPAEDKSDKTDRLQFPLHAFSKDSLASSGLGVWLLTVALQQTRYEYYSRSQLKLSLSSTCRVLLMPTMSKADISVAVVCFAIQSRARTYM